MTNWQKKIYEGMKLLKEGCEQCSKEGVSGYCGTTCPFDKMCDKLYEEYGTPEDWNSI